MATVFVGSRLPFGLTLEHPVTGAKVEIDGHSRSDGGRIIVPYGETEVDKDYWDAWVKENKDYPAPVPLASFSPSQSKRAGPHGSGF